MTCVRMMMSLSLSLSLSGWAVHGSLWPGDIPDGTVTLDDLMVRVHSNGDVDWLVGLVPPRWSDTDTDTDSDTDTEACRLVDGLWPALSTRANSILPIMNQSRF